MSNIKVIGVVGHPASGKDTVADYLGSKGWNKISMGDALRQKMRERGITTERSNMHEFVKEQRLRHGNSYPANEIVDTLIGNTVVSGFRNTEEIGVFKRRFANDFILIAVDAPVHIRHARAQARKRTGDGISLEQFMAEEHRERSADSGTHEVDRVIQMADIVLPNSGPKEELFKKLEALDL